MFSQVDLFSDARVQFHMAQVLVLRRDVAQESRNLSAAELELCRLLKPRQLGLAAIERTRRRQCARITWLRAGDASTTLFHARINSMIKRALCMITSRRSWAGDRLTLTQSIGTS